VITNPLVGSKKPGYKQGWTFGKLRPPDVCWNSSALCEVADACDYIFRTTDKNNSNMLVGKKRFLVQATWQQGFGCTIYKIKK